MDDGGSRNKSMLIPPQHVTGQLRRQRSARDRYELYSLALTATRRFDAIEWRRIVSVDPAPPDRVAGPLCRQVKYATRERDGPARTRLPPWR